nr:MAG TPA: hypothetical protein [Caudoviricetes sp.]
MLQGFEQYFPNKRIELIVSRTGGVTFKAGAIQSLGKCDFIQIFFKDDERLLAIQAAKESDNAVIPVRSKNSGVRCNSSDLVRKVLSLIDMDFSVYSSYKTEGVYLPKENAVVFDLKRATGSKKK